MYSKEENLPTHSNACHVILGSAGSRCPWFGWSSHSTSTTAFCTNPILPLPLCISPFTPHPPSRKYTSKSKATESASTACQPLDAALSATTGQPPPLGLHRCLVGLDLAVPPKAQQQNLRPSGVVTHVVCHDSPTVRLLPLLLLQS